ncbi:MAG: glycosyltransferase [Cytophaga sp.]|nr:glycosyltransferase [Undibacterium sp.]
MKISIITPCYNAERYLDETVQSVLSQNAVKSGRVELDYWIIDGASTDGTQALIAKYKDCEVNIISERDAGMYDALAKGFKRVNGDIVAYLNAGDYYHPTAFDVIADIMSKPNVKWLTATNFIYNENSQIVEWVQPQRYKSNLIAQGAYGTVLPFIQQESTFWRRELLEIVNFENLAKLRYAGDFFLWHQFCKHAELDIVKAHISGFKVHEGQLSQIGGAYLAEMKLIAPAVSSWQLWLAAKFESIVQALPGRLRRLIGIERIYEFNRRKKCWSIKL